MQSRTWVWVSAVVVLLIIVVGVAYMAGTAQSADKTAVINTTESFGESLQKVSLLAPQEEFSNEVDQAYGPYAAPLLISTWKQDASIAPGRKTSSPWPARIAILTTTKQAEDTYVVTGNVEEVTSANGGAVAATYPVVLTLTKNEDGKWLISRFERGAETSTASTTPAQ